MEGGTWLTTLYTIHYKKTYHYRRFDKQTHHHYADRQICWVNSEWDFLNKQKAQQYLNQHLNELKEGYIISYDPWKRRSLISRKHVLSVYDVYQNEVYLCSGTAKELAKRFDTTERYLRWLSTPSSLKRPHNHNGIVAIKVAARVEQPDGSSIEIEKEDE